MSKKKKNSFENICNKLEENYVMEEKNNVMGKNQITYTREYLKSDLKIDEDKDMLLKIKAEAEEADYITHFSFVFSTLVMFFTAINVIIQLLPIDEVTILKILYLIAVIIVLIPVLLRMFSGKFNAAVRWRNTFWLL